MLGLILATMINLNCPDCGGVHMDAIVITESEVITIHDTEDAMPGDLYWLQSVSGSIHSDSYELAEYIRYYFDTVQ